ncbi:MAG: pyruvate synthase subunit beta [SAR324 cluster bacterium]|nr:pyruvate synthase subunit beta [SAR324 cluster bacterium]
MQQLNTHTKELLYPGHNGCAGCGAVIAMKLALRALGEKTVMVIPACCWAVIAGAYPQTSLKVPILHTAFASSGATATGVKAALDAKGDTETTVVAWAGDGGTFDIGLQSFSGAAERNEDFIYVCYDNEAYMNTGMQRSSSTPFGSRTTTTPGSSCKNTRKKNILEIMADHRIPYAATANIAYPDDLTNKFEKALAIKKGTRFIHIFASCPTGWNIPTEWSVKTARLASQTNVFPLYEVEKGLEYKLNFQGDRPVKDYLSIQGRFKHLKDSDFDHIQKNVDKDWDILKRKINTN